MEQEQTWGFSRGGEISRDEIKFTKFVSKLRKRFSDLFYTLLRTQLVAKGIISSSEWNSYKENIDFVFADDGYFSEIKKLEMLNQRIEILDTISQGEMIGRYYSIEWVRKNILMQTDDEIEAMDKTMEQEKAGRTEDEDGESDDLY
jgi:hypothetical protein